MKITVECGSIGELLEIAAKLASGQPVPLAEEGAPAPAPAPAVEPEPIEPPASRRPGRPRKTPIETPTVEPAPTEAPTATKPEPPKHYVLNDVRQALQKYAGTTGQNVADETGLVRARTLLSQFKTIRDMPVQKLSELQDKDFAAVIAAAGGL